MEIKVIKVVNDSNDMVLQAISTECGREEVYHNIFFGHSEQRSQAAGGDSPLLG